MIDPAISSELACRKEIAWRFKATAIPPLNSGSQSTPKIKDFSGSRLKPSLVSGFRRHRTVSRLSGTSWVLERGGPPFRERGLMVNNFDCLMGEKTMQRICFVYTKIRCASLATKIFKNNRFLRTGV